MGEKSLTEEVRCARCGADHVVTYNFSDFGPANSEHETANCQRCGARLVRKRCLSVDARLKEAN